MNELNQNMLEIAEIREVKESKDGRNYRTVGFGKITPKGVYTNAKPRFRNLWEEGPYGSRGDTLYKAIEEGKAKVGSKVFGSIESVEVEPFYIPNENGKYADPETGEASNKVDRFTSVVFEDESIEQLARNQELIIPGDTTEKEEVPEHEGVGELVDEEEVVPQS